jgi:hypothetical protein
MGILNKHTMKARVGHLVKVKNLSKKRNENEIYYAALLKDNSGFTNFIFTESEMKVAFDRARRNKEDCLSRSIASYLLD